MKGKTILLVLGGITVAFLGYRWYKSRGEKDLMHQAAIRNQQRQVEKLVNTPGGLGDAIDLAATPVAPPASTSTTFPLGILGGRLA